MHPRYKWWGLLIAAVFTITIIFIVVGEQPNGNAIGKFSTLNVGVEKQIGIGLHDRVGALEEQISMLQRRFWLEQLEPTFHFRSKFWLGKTDNVEDKSQVIPFFLANFVDTASHPRRIYIDLGVNTFESSICWIMQHYPVKFDRIYGFECGIDLRDVDALALDVRRCINGTTAQSIGYKIVKDVIDSMSLYHNYIGVDDDASTSPPTKGLSGFLEDVEIHEDDFVVMKMDVDGVEFDLIERMLRDGSYKLVDELFVEVHYTHPDMYPWGWVSDPHSLGDAQALFTKARDAGMFVHPWP